VVLAPVIRHGAATVDAELPPGRWQHIWTGEVHGSGDEVTEVTVAAPVGQPALFVREGTAVAEELAAFVAGERG
jgi:alpha-glucosidase